ncbi:MAG: hypothetical protein OXS35_08190 [Dehalococcoidia bacterium]|nr:hypothetical protein [Dehalococcoidia bacterium]
MVLELRPTIKPVIGRNDALSVAERQGQIHQLFIGGVGQLWQRFPKAQQGRGITGSVSL